MRPSCLNRLGNIDELRAAARRRLPRPVFDFLDGGAEDEWTLRQNSEAFDRRAFLPRTLVDVAQIDSSTTLLGQKIAWPVILAPTGMTRMFHPEGERAVARAAGNAETVYTLSTMSSVSIEEIGAIGGAPKWFQLYCFRDRELTKEFLARAKASGFQAVVVTVDVPVAANRERDRRSGMTIPVRLSLKSALSFAVRPGWTFDYLRHAEPILANVVHKIAEGSVSLSTVSAYIGRQFDPCVNWKDLAWLAGEWGGPVIVKGILHPDDARSARDAGARAVMVSNHGGRQLDGAAASLDALPAIADAVGSDMEIILDGGVRRGTHVLKALALGARACSIGRPYLYGLVAGGEAGVERALTVLRAEIVRDMALLGARTVRDISRTMLTP